MKKVKAKKHLGQHFLSDLSIAENTVAAFGIKNNFTKAVEIGPGMGVLTNFLLERADLETYVIDIDTESIAFLEEDSSLDNDHIIEGDFLQFDLTTQFGSAPIGIIGNFPYNISTQILFKVLEHKEQVKEVVGMFQKEVAERVVSPPGSKVYGITSVLLQAFYTVEYLFTVEAEVFDPPPKVQSAVIRLQRNQVDALPCDEKRFKQVVKMAFNQRRKTLRNSLKSLLSDEIKDREIFNERPEQLSVEQFIALTKLLFS